MPNRVMGLEGKETTHLKGGKGKEQKDIGKEKKRKDRD